MAVRLSRTPELKDPIMLACWPGIGNIGLLAVDTVRQSVVAEDLGYVEPWDFFYPKKVIIRDGEMITLEFPSSKFYFKKAENRDLLFFIGEEQPVWGNKPYAEGAKAYQMANYVLDVAEKFGCRKIFTSGAAVTSIHHSMRSKVWAVPNTPSLIDEIKTYGNTILMSQVEGVGGQGSITGLNGLLLGVALKRGMEAICVMGEIPVYLQGFPLIYPKASISVIEVLSSALGLDIDMTGITGFAERTEQEINSLYDRLPPEARAQLEGFKTAPDSSGDQSKITEEDKKKILEDIDKFFQIKGKEEGEN